VGITREAACNSEIINALSLLKVIGLPKMLGLFKWVIRYGLVHLRSCAPHPERDTTPHRPVLWLRLYLSIHVSSILRPFVHGSLGNLKTS